MRWQSLNICLRVVTVSLYLISLTMLVFTATLWQSSLAQSLLKVFTDSDKQLHVINKAKPSQATCEQNKSKHNAALVLCEATIYSFLFVRY